MINEKLATVKKNIPSNVTLVAVSKTKPNELIEEAYKAGQRIFGENKAQELKNKAEVLPKDIQWHFIGHLQRNKVKYIAPHTSLIHSIDSIQLLTEVNKQGLKNNRIIDCLLQFHIATEESKFGLSLEEATELLNSNDFLNLKNIKIVGVMGMASFINNEEQVRNEFIRLKDIFTQLNNNFFNQTGTFQTISMGMSGDYRIAIEEGSTMIRVGSAIFGNRN
ncbi:MAG: YggS family pyridoxal phosphate-dependent enzyme [Flavobacteriales bacterium]|nr:YggS family pyridoxal phosphate-dependent enzyme [Flavobacteriales bacterium]